MDADLVAAIAEFRSTLPGWWFSVGECSVSRDASCGPDNAYCSKALLVAFDSGFHADLTEPNSTMADALRQVTRDAVAALAALDAGVTA